jgi:hypothetical protein
MFREINSGPMQFFSLQIGTVNLNKELPPGDPHLVALLLKAELAVDLYFLIMQNLILRSQRLIFVD